MHVIFDESRPELRGISEYYNHQLLIQLGRLERERVEAVLKSKKTAKLVLKIGGAATIISCFIFNPAVAFVTGFILTGIIALLVRAFQSNKAYYDASLFLSEKLCRFVGWKYRRDPVKVPNLAVFTQLGLLTRDKDRISLEDQILGRRNGRKFHYIECHIESRHEREDDEGNIEVYWVTEFKGALLQTKFTREFLGKLVVLNDSDYFIGWQDRMKRVGLEDPVFEKIFEAYGNDQVEARYILTPTFMQKLVDMSQKISRDFVRLGFYNNQVFATIYNADRFEIAGTKAKITDGDQVMKTMGDIEDIFTIMDAIVDD